MSDLSPLWISLKISVVAGLVTCGLGIVVAYGMMHYQGKGKSLLDSVLLLPLVLPPTVIGFVLLQLLSDRGLIGSLLQRFNVSVIFSWQGGAIAAVVVTFPLIYRTALAAFEQTDPHLLAAARLLGASESRIFWQIALPLARRGLIAGSILAWARGLGEFGATVMIAGNIPGRTATLPLAIYTAVETGDYASAWRWSGLIFAIALTAIAGLNIYLDRNPHSQLKHRGSQSRDVQHLISSSSQSLSGRNKLAVELHHSLPDFDLDVKFQTESGIMAILGASGTGKSMLLRLIAGLERPDQGRIALGQQIFCDTNLGRHQPSRSRRVGIVFQNYALFPHLTVADNIAFGLPPHLSAMERDRRITNWLEHVQLPEIGDRYPHQLSGGQQQRVALVRALASDPEILLLDEPFSALDQHLYRSLAQALARVLQDYRGLTFLVTHRIDLAYRLCPRWLALDRGQIIANGTREQLWRQPQSLTLAQLLGCENIAPVQRSRDRLHIPAWNHSFNLPTQPEYEITHAGLRATTVGAALSAQQTSPATGLLCWVVRREEMPDRVVLYLEVRASTRNTGNLLHANLTPGRWRQLSGQPQPWQLQLTPEDYLLLSR